MLQQHQLSKLSPFERVTVTLWALENRTNHDATLAILCVHFQFRLNSANLQFSLKTVLLQVLIVPRPSGCSF